MDLIGQALHEVIGFDDRATLIEKHRWQPHRGEHFAGALGALQAETRRYQRAAGEVWPQFVEAVDPLLFDRAPAVLPLHAKNDIVTGRHPQPGTRRPAKAVGTKKITIDRIAVDLIGGPET